MVDGSLDPASGAYLIRAEIADDLGGPEELEPLVHCSVALDSWEESWGVPVAVLEAETIEAARVFLRTMRTAEEAADPDPALAPDRGPCPGI